MIHVIMGLKGTGKTKKLIDTIHDTVASASGDVVCIEYGKKLTYDVNYRVRLVDSKEYCITNPDMLKGFLSGTIAYGVMLLMWAVSHMEMLMESIHTMDLKQFAISVLLRYLLFLVVYLAAVFVYAQTKYTRAKKEIKGYNRHLKRLIGSFERDGGES